MTPKKPYRERSDFERIESQWRKLSGLHGREEWSAAVMRAATAAEIAANLAIRAEFQQQGHLSPRFVDGLLGWANGLRGKMDRVLLPLLEGTARYAQISTLTVDAHAVNELRNGIAHRGEFCNREEAETAIASADRFVRGILQVYGSEFKLKEIVELAR
jgi:hypothetical protein